MSHAGSSIVAPIRSRFRLVRVRSVSDAAILATAFITGVFLCWNAGIANAFMFKVGGPAAGILVRSNQFLMLVVIFQLWKLLRWGRERNDLLHERNKVTVRLNHTIRNACQVILMCTYTDKGADPTVSNSVLQIKEALEEYVPNAFVVVPPQERTGDKSTRIAPIPPRDSAWRN